MWSLWPDSWVSPSRGIIAVGSQSSHRKVTACVPPAKLEANTVSAPERPLRVQYYSVSCSIGSWGFLCFVDPSGLLCYLSLAMPLYTALYIP